MANVRSFKIELTFGATLSIANDDGTNSFNFIKPEVSGSVGWDTVPTGVELADIVEMLATQVTQPILEELIQRSKDTIQELKR